MTQSTESKPAFKHFNFYLNDTELITEAPAGITLGDLVRNYAYLKGTKIACREGDCGACCMLVGKVTKDQKNSIRSMSYKSVTSCISPGMNHERLHVVTIDGLLTNNPKSMHSFQKAFYHEGASQCGYCTPGFMISLFHYFLNFKEGSYSELNTYMDGNICRCTGYFAIERALNDIYKNLVPQIDKEKDRIEELLRLGIIPHYFSETKKKMIRIHEQAQNLKRQDGGQIDSTVETTDILHAGSYIAGGTDLNVQRPLDLFYKKNYQLQSSQSTYQANNEIIDEEEYIKIGAQTTLEELRLSPIMLHHFPFLKESLTLFASTPIRNQGTLAGNLVNASPIGDFTSMFLAMNGSIEYIEVDTNKKETVKIDDFYLSYKKTKLPHKAIITALFIDKPVPEKSFYHFAKVSKRKILDIASVNSTINIEVDQKKCTNIRVSAGGVHEIPYLIKGTAFSLKQKVLNSENIRAFIKGACDEIKPIGDIRGSVPYKSRLYKHLLAGHFATLFPEFNFSDLIADR